VNSLGVGRPRKGLGFWDFWQSGAPSIEDALPWPLRSSSWQKMELRTYARWGNGEDDTLVAEESDFVTGVGAID
jgi:hypothetical protein